MFFPTIPGIMRALPMRDSPDVRAAQCECLENIWLVREPSRHRDIGDPHVPFLHFPAEIVHERFEIEGRDTPFIHHRPRAHPGPRMAPSMVRRSIFASELYLHCHGKFDHEYAPVFRVIRLNPISRRPVDLFEKPFPGDEPEPRMPLEFLYRTVPESLLGSRGEEDPG